MVRPARIALLAATLAPIGYFFAVYRFVGKPMTQAPADSLMTAAWMSQFNRFMVFNAVFVFWLMGLLAIYLIHLYRTSSVPDGRRAFWAVVLFMGNMVAMPIYWYLYVWRERTERTAA